MLPKFGFQGNKVKLVRLHTDNKESLIGKTVFLTGFGIIDGIYILENIFEYNNKN